VTLTVSQPPTPFHRDVRDNRVARHRNEPSVLTMSTGVTIFRGEEKPLASPPPIAATALRMTLGPVDKQCLSASKPAVVSPAAILQSVARSVTRTKARTRNAPTHDGERPPSAVTTRRGPAVANVRRNLDRYLCQECLKHKPPHAEQDRRPHHPRACPSRLAVGVGQHPGDLRSVSPTQDH